MKYLIVALCWSLTDAEVLNAFHMSLLRIPFYITNRNFSKFNFNITFSGHPKAIFQEAGGQRL